MVIKIPCVCVQSNGFLRAFGVFKLFCQFCPVISFFFTEFSRCTCVQNSTIVTQAYFVVNCCTGPFVYIAFILLCSLYSLSVVCIYRFRVGLTSLTMMRV